MPDQPAGNSVPRILLGQQLRKLREHKGIHAEDAAAEVGVARATLWRMEKGDFRCRFKPGDVERLARFYGADPDLTEALVEMTRATRRRGWLTLYRDLVPDSLAIAIELETYATRIRCYADAMVPELLQVEQYTTAQLKSSPRMNAIDIRRHTQIRTHRQEVLDRNPQPALFEFILDEAALRHTVGEPEVMRAQLAALVDRVHPAKVSIRVVPYRTGMYAGLETGSFTLLDFPAEDQLDGLPRTVTFNQLGEHVLLDKPREVDQYQECWDDIRAYAFDQATSTRLITDTAQEAKTPD